MEPHGNGSADEFAAQGPKVLALIFCDGQVVCSEEQELDELEAVRPALGMVAL